MISLCKLSTKDNEGTHDTLYKYITFCALVNSFITLFVDIFLFEISVIDMWSLENPSDVTVPEF